MGDPADELAAGVLDGRLALPGCLQHPAAGFEFGGERGKLVAHDRGLDPRALAAADAPGGVGQFLGVPRHPRSQHEGDRNGHRRGHGQDVPHDLKVPCRDEHGVEGADHSRRQDGHRSEHHHADLHREGCPAQRF